PSRVLGGLMQSGDPIWGRRRVAGFTASRSGRAPTTASVLGADLSAKNVGRLSTKAGPGPGPGMKPRSACATRTGWTPRLRVLVRPLRHLYQLKKLRIDASPGPWCATMAGRLAMSFCTITGVAAPKWKQSSADAVPWL